MNDAPSLSVSYAGYRLGVSGSTVKRMIRDNELAWFHTRGPNGHIRALAESVEKFRQPGETRSAAASGRLVAGRRENVEALRAEIEECKLKRDVSKLDAEHAEAERRRAATARAEELERKRVAEETRLQVVREAAERRVRQREQEEAEERSVWVNGWILWTLKSVPKDAPREVVLDVRQSVEEALAKLTPEQPQSVVQRLVLAALDRGLAPWRRRKEIETAIQSARKELPVFVRTLSDYFEPTH